MIDVRDSMFQSDPFAFTPTDKPFFHAFAGVESRTIGECGWNGGWVKDCFGESVRPLLRTMHCDCGVDETSDRFSDDYLFRRECREHRHRDDVHAHDGGYHFRAA